MRTGRTCEILQVIKKKENTNSTLGEEEQAEGEAKPEASV